MLPSIDLRKIFEGVIEVLDPSSGALIASREVDGGFLGFLDPGVVYQVEESESGDVTLRLWRLALRR